MKIIGGDYGGRNLKTTVGPGYRPAMAKVRKALFSMLEARGVHWPECRVLDLFAGSGSCGFEALSRGAQEAWFIENNPKAVNVIKTNAATLGVEQSRWQVFYEDVNKFLRVAPARPFDLVLIDPPYGKNFVSPAATALLRNRWLSDDAMIVAEAEAAVTELPEVDSRLELLVNRTYGQTRILIWGRQAEK
ncbi:16S rRNA (guanine(966)-N(2))-methyltransferase RsmD [Oleidesulfovibrio sp.]|uniref:16S rRNA (guanine(966)-N(2))-methyltransferase RsmD n=1 Tax=Oleidesulfovibrio sp. TaxID=2909707 RepID=UPI003A86369C